MLTPGSAGSGWGGGPQGRGAPRGAHRTPFKRGPRARRGRRGARGPHLEKEPVAELHDVGLVDGRDLAPVVQERKPERVLHRAPRLLRRDHLRRGAAAALAAWRRDGGAPGAVGRANDLPVAPLTAACSAAGPAPACLAMAALGRRPPERSTSARMRGAHTRPCRGCLSTSASTPRTSLLKPTQAAAQRLDCLTCSTLPYVRPQGKTSAAGRDAERVGRARLDALDDVLHHLVLQAGVLALRVFPAAAPPRRQPRARRAVPPAAVRPQRPRLRVHRLLSRPSPTSL